MLFRSDRGYGRATQFAALLEAGADFIIRIAPTNIRLYTDETCRNRVEFSALLSGSAAERLSLHCWFRVRKKVYPLRITASRIPEEQTEAAEKRVRAKASKSGRKILVTTILFCRWVVLASSLPTAIRGRDLFHVYRLRWQVELFFKRCKSLLNFHKLRKSNSDYLFAVASDFLAIVYLVSSLVLRFSELFSLTSLLIRFLLLFFLSFLLKFPLMGGTPLVGVIHKRVSTHPLVRRPRRTGESLQKPTGCKAKKKIKKGLLMQSFF